MDKNVTLSIKECLNWIIFKFIEYIGVSKSGVSKSEEVGDFKITYFIWIIKKKKTILLKQIFKRGKKIT